MKTAKPAEEKKQIQRQANVFDYSTIDGQSTCRDSRQSGQTIVMKDNKTVETLICLPRNSGSATWKLTDAQIPRRAFRRTHLHYNARVE